MKKLFAIALALVMALSLASAASAAWNQNPVTEPTAKFPTVEVIKFVKKTAAGGTWYYEVNSNANAINDANLYFVVKVVMPSDVKVADVKYKLSFDGINATGVDCNLADVLQNDTDTFASGTYYWTGTQFTSSGNVARYVLEARCSDTDTAKVTAAISKKSPFGTITKSGYAITRESDINVSVSKDGRMLLFTRDASTGLVSKVEYLPSTAALNERVNVVSNSSISSGFTFDAVGGISLTGSEHETFVRNVFALCGFSMYNVANRAIYMSDDNCIANFGINMKVTSSKSWSASSAPIIVDNPTVIAPTIPKTGDIIGIGAALMTLIAAAGALSFRRR